MKRKDFPEKYIDVMVTFKNRHNKIVTMRGFYNGEIFLVPDEWAYFKGVYLPYGWGSHHLSPSKIINWKEII